jgi:hypothetical protein
MIIIKIMTMNILVLLLSQVHVTIHTLNNSRGSDLYSSLQNSK